MKIISVKATNFGSYSSIERTFSDGLYLLSGPTGCGKSTFCDIVPWVLFGRTAKGGTVDEIRNWFNTDDTVGELVVQTNPDCEITIKRIRGVSNDLYYTTVPITVHAGVTEPTRGKDLNDTQKRLNALIGIDLETYLAGAYFNEFSQVASFFTASAKVRKAICDQLVDSVLLQQLTSNLSKAKPKARKAVEEADIRLSTLIHEKFLLEQSHNDLEKKERQWKKQLESTIASLKEDSATFKQTKNKAVRQLRESLIQVEAAIPSLLELKQEVEAKIIQTRQNIETSSKCKECGSSIVNKILLNDLKSMETQNMKREYELKALAAKKEDLMRCLQDERQREDTSAIQIQKIEGQDSPYRDLLIANGRRARTVREGVGRATEERGKHWSRFVELETLSELTASMRGQLMSTTVVLLEERTNAMIEQHFDGVFRLALSAEEDKIDIEIHKDGVPCSYTQLSKGQRQIIKLCFSLSTMEAVANNHGVTFSTVFLDEALDGMDSQLKIKAIALIKSLTYDSIYIVDHDAGVKEAVDNHIQVELINGRTLINEA